jgi:hypothetical protein
MRPRRDVALDELSDRQPRRWQRTRSLDLNEELGELGIGLPLPGPIVGCTNGPEDLLTLAVARARGPSATDLQTPDRNRSKRHEGPQTAALRR